MKKKRISKKHREFITAELTRAALNLKYHISAAFKAGMKRGEVFEIVIGAGLHGR